MLLLHIPITMEKSSSSLVPTYRFAFVLLTSLFFLWGLAHNMTDTLLAAFKRIMSMNDFQTSWIQVAFYGSYFCLALPAAIINMKASYKTSILAGLIMYAGGALLFYPASITMQYSHFLVALFILAGGLAVLETAANPYVLEFGPEATATRRLNLAQSFNPLGSISGILLSKVFILSHLNVAGVEERSHMTSGQLAQVRSSELSAVMGPYVGVAIVLIVLTILIGITKMPVAGGRQEIQLVSSFKRLFRNRNYVWGLVAQFFYVGAQIGVWSFTIRYIQLEFAASEDTGATFYAVSIILFSSSRFVFTALMKYYTPQKLLLFAASAAALCTVIACVASGWLGVIALIFISGFMSLMFPTIYGLSLRGVGADTKIGGAGLVMTIVGGAVLTPIQGKLSDMSHSIHIAYLVPLLCFVVIMYYAAAHTKETIAETNPQ